jgi:hypothetical protein
LNFKIFFGILGLEAEVKRNKSVPNADDDQLVTFDFRMPKGAQKFMIFERLQFLLEQKHRKEPDGFLRIQELKS